MNETLGLIIIGFLMAFMLSLILYLARALDIRVGNSKPKEWERKLWYNDYLRGLGK